MSEITLVLEHPSLGCGEIIARYDLSEIQEKAYKQGRADKEKELAEGNVFFSNKPIENIVREARADAIEECIKIVKDYFCELIEKHEEWDISSIYDFALIPNKNICEALERLKERQWKE